MPPGAPETRRRAARRAEAERLLDLVHLDPALARSHPARLSGVGVRSADGPGADRTVVRRHLLRRGSVSALPAVAERGPAGLGGRRRRGRHAVEHRLDLADPAHRGLDAHAATPLRWTASASSSRVFWERRAHSASCSALRRSLSLSIAWRSRAAAASTSRRTATSASRRDSSIEASIWTRSVLLEQGLTLRAHAQLAAQVLTGALFGAFTKRSDSLEPERERGGLHDGSIGKWGPDLK